MTKKEARMINILVFPYNVLITWIIHELKTKF